EPACGAESVDRTHQPDVGAGRAAEGVALAQLCMASRAGARGADSSNAEEGGIMTAAFLAAAALSMGPDTTATVRDKVREAVRYEELVEQGPGVVIRGRASLMGGEGEYSLVFDGAGRFALETAGPLSRTLAFDGNKAWEIDFQGTPRVLELGDRASG